jgi:hypothetical protein
MEKFPAITYIDLILAVNNVHFLKHILFTEMRVDKKFGERVYHLKKPFLSD